jgi:hypothetical protein
MSKTMKYNYVGTEHILMALVREGSGVAAEVLRLRLLNINGLRLLICLLRRLSGRQLLPTKPALGCPRVNRRPTLRTYIFCHNSISSLKKIIFFP